MTSEFESQIKDLVDREVVGRAVERFLTTVPGLVLVRRAQDEIDHAIQELKTIPATDAGRILTLQERIRFNEGLHAWLADAIIEAENATTTLAAIESQD